MSVICQCLSCKTKYQVGDQYAGRTVKCPKCSAAVVVPAAAQPTSQPDAAAKISSSGDAAKAASAPVSSKPVPPKRQVAARLEDRPVEPAPTLAFSAKIPRAVVVAPADTAADDQDTDFAPPADDDGLGFLAEELAKPIRRAGPAVAKRPSDEVAPLRMPRARRPPACVWPLARPGARAALRPRRRSRVSPRG